MKSLALSFAFAALIGVSITQTGPSSLVSKHAEKLGQAKSMQVTFTVQVIGGSSEEHRLTLSKPSNLRWEAPDKTTITDGKTVWTYIKSKKQYTEAPLAEGDLLKLMSDDRLWMWSAFFDAKFKDQIASTKAGKARKIKNAATTEVAVTFSKRTNSAVVLFVDDALGVARGGLWQNQLGQTIISAEPITLSETESDAKLFAFVPPADAQKLDASAISSQAIPYSEINAIFMGNCTGCHGSNQQRSGLNLTNYDSVMRGGRGGKIVEPGSPEQSRILNYLRGKNAPIMPPGRPMPSAVVDKIEAWIKAGANKE